MDVRGLFVRCAKRAVEFIKAPLIAPAFALWLRLPDRGAHEASIPRVIAIGLHCGCMDRGPVAACERMSFERILPAATACVRIVSEGRGSNSGLAGRVAAATAPFARPPWLREFTPNQRTACGARAAAAHILRATG
jgi:hypothetical protein